MLDTVYIYTAPAAQVLMWLLLIWLNCFFQIIEERFRLPPSSEMHIGLPTDWGEYVDLEEINQL